MKKWIILLALMITASCFKADAQTMMGVSGITGGGSSSVANEEFVGPFSTWTNVKTACGATGNGTTDDTAAIQTCLNGISFSAPVIYFPAGTYKITSTLTLSAQLYISLMGADPATTTILWAGSSGGVMLYLNGNAYSRFDRLTFNGQGNAAVAVDQSWDNSTGSFDTGNEYADDVFENAGIGLRCGNLGYGCAETSMLRDQFLNNTFGGIDLMDYDALDMWVWYSLFQNNEEGVSNAYGAGNFHVYQSIFQNSTNTDIHVGGAGPFNFRNNYSIGSNRFGDLGGSCSPYNITIQGNTILDTTQPDSIRFAGLGPHLLIDNVVRSLAGATGPAVREQSCVPNLFSMGNTFTVSPTTAPNGGLYNSVQDQVVDRSTINPTMPTLPGTPPNLGRTIYEASTSGSGTACTTASPCSIQQAITNAATGCANNVAHIQLGSYSVGTTIIVPANCPVQIIGDGYTSSLVSSGANPVVRLQGPSKAVLRDFAVIGNSNSADGIEVDNADQASSRVFMEEVTLGSSYTNLFVDGLDYTNVELYDFNHVYDSTTGMTSVVVTGGPSAAAGSWLGGVTNIFAGSSTGNYFSYGVSNGAHAAVETVWDDAGSPQVAVANVTGPSTFTYAGSALNLPTGTSLAISLNNFQGTAALVELYTPNGDVNITGNGTGAQVLGLSLFGPSDPFFNDTTSPADTTEFLSSMILCTGVSPPDAPPCPNPNPDDVVGIALPEVPTTPDTAFLTATLNQLRTTQPTWPMPPPLPSGVTDVRLYRVNVSSAATGIHLEH